MSGETPEAAERAASRRQCAADSVMGSALRLADALREMTRKYGVWADDEVFDTLGIASALDGLEQDVFFYRQAIEAPDPAGGSGH